MTSIPANVQSFSAGNRTGQSKVQAPGSKEDFSKVLDRQKTGTSKESGVKPQEQKGTSTGETVKAQGQKETSQEAEFNETVQTEGGETSAEGTVTEQGQQTETAETPRPTDLSKDGPAEKEVPQEGLEQAMEVLQSAILQIQELLMQQLNLSPQELEQLMRQEGFTDIQLLQPETVNQLVLDATGAEDSLTLVMDENLYHSQQTITQGYQEITRGLEEELKDEGGLHKALESLENGMNSQTVQEPDKSAESLWQESGQEQSGRQREHAAQQEQNQTVTGQTLYQNYNSQAQSQVMGQTNVTTAPTGAAYAEIPDSQQVMNQILDYMKVSMRPENTVLNMQLIRRIWERCTFRFRPKRAL